jgi:hypothetical protein
VADRPVESISREIDAGPGGHTHRRAQKARTVLLKGLQERASRLVSSI